MVYFKLLSEVGEHRFGGRFTRLASAKQQTGPSTEVAAGFKSAFTAVTLH